MMRCARDRSAQWFAAQVHGADLGAHVIKALVDRNPIPAAEYDDVVFGCADTIGALAGDIACMPLPAC